ncbi:MAG: ABC transporter ATP-binding protein [Chitinophagales bacterium]
MESFKNKSGQTVLQLEHVSKWYHLDTEPVNPAAVAVAGKGKFLAVKDVSFSLKKGEVLGIIGSNGAGKSTLLKMISGVSKPSEGKISITGTLGSLLEIGAGFSPDLTGRDNVFLTAQILGIAKPDAQSCMDEIVSFSGIADFIDVPVKYYSSGMYTRLAFSTMSVLRTDILLLDEIFSVGDAEFSLKSSEAIRRLSSDGRGVILVSHNLEGIKAICDRVIWIEEGAIVAEGNVADVLEQYYRKVYHLDEPEARTPKEQKENADAGRKQNSPRRIEGIFELNGVEVKAVGKKKGEEIYLEEAIEISLDYTKFSSDAKLDFVLNIQNSTMVNVLTDCLLFRLDGIESPVAQGRYRLSTVVPANLLNRGVYSLHVIVLQNTMEVVAEYFRIVSFNLGLNPEFRKHPNFEFISHYTETIPAVIRPNLNWTITSVE